MGQLCEVGTVSVGALGGTIAYDINWNKAKTEKYKLEVLTIATDMNGFNYNKCKIGKNEGAAGHVLLTYPSGGSILTSCGHWVELVKLDVSKE